MRPIRPFFFLIEIRPYFWYDSCVKLSPYLISVFILSVFVSQAFCDMNEVETAIMKQDFVLSKKLAMDVLNFAVVKKDVAVEAKYYLGISHLRLEEYTEAIILFRGLLKDNPPDDIRDKAYIGLIESYYQQEKYKMAQKSVKKLLKTSPRSPFLSLIYLKAARINLKLTNWNEANWYLDQIVERFPNSFEYHTALQLLDEKQYFAVQVGAFVEPNRAELLVEVLKSNGHYAYIVETVDRNNTKFYRVRVGQMTVLKEAERLKSKLAKSGYPAWIYP